MDKFCLKWNDFQTSVTNSFSKLKKEDDFYDVTLVTDDNKQMSAHKLVIADESMTKQICTVTQKYRL